MIDDDNYIRLMKARRAAERHVEFQQHQNGHKVVTLPTHEYESLMEAARQILLEQLKD
jgi:hypothetical protein